MSDWIIKPKFIACGPRRIFVIMRHPPRAGGRAVLVVPPFADEMNKCRSMLTQVACALASRGWASVIPDLYGTGDSEGEFHEADWDLWLEDVACVAKWSAALGWPIRAMLCVRTGCLLGADVATRLDRAIERSVFWQPVAEGARFLTQFLRLRIAASMMSGEKETVAQLRAELSRSGRLEVSGYELSLGLARRIESSRLEAVLGPSMGKLHWIEVVRDAEIGLGAASARLVDAARAAGMHVTTAAVPGEPFWATAETVRLPALVSQTIDALVGAR